ncbi:hypothetical protein N9139_00035 [Akkermansiaceae bacterium]|nr:hypothetical protein [Akkermansiaceae bacterium]
MSGAEILLSICLTVFVLCTIGGVIKFVQMVRILMNGKPPVDPNLVLTEEDFKDDE